MGAVSDRVRSCGDGWHGSLQVRAEFESSGTATNASVTTGDVPAPVMACVEGVVMTARVPAFRARDFTVSYPFRL
ncbi:MAG: hypothetical protein AB8I08_19060 [Sandaracinaceae bacterium]